MIKINSKLKCSGCNACSEICPQNCISMDADEEGFWYPFVDINNCIECDMCEKVCPIINLPKTPLIVPDAFAAYNTKDNIRMLSSSGGIFSLLAETHLSLKGIVYGAAWKDNYTVHHISITNINDLDLLRGSKYLQSETFNIFSNVEKQLKNDKKVLFSGTACQIAGLKNYLNKDYDNLITIDLLCHGVPSPKVWKKYLIWQELKFNSEAINSTFRYKNSGWKNYSIKILFKNSENYTEKFQKDIFMKFFLSNVCLRPSCHACNFKDLSRCSDITIGDFWGIEKIAPEMDDNKGTSLVLIHSEKGHELFNEIQSKMNFRQVDVNLALPVKADSRHSVKEHPKRATFFRSLDNQPIEYLSKIIEKSMYNKSILKVKSIIKYLIKK